MKLTIKKKGLLDNYLVLDEKGTQKYQVAKEITFLNELHVFDPSGTELAHISEKPHIIGASEYDVLVNGEVVDQIKYTLKGLRSQYNLVKADWHTKGNLTGKKYEIIEGSTTIAHATKKMLAIQDTYEVTFDRPEDELMLVILILTINTYKDDSEDN